MECITIRAVSYLFIVVASLEIVTTRATDPDQPSPMTNTTRGRTLRFYPCRIVTKLTAKTKKHLMKVGMSIISSCGLSIVPLIEDSWGPITKIVSFLPKARFLGCVAVRVLYGFFSTDNGRLSPQIAANATQIFNLATRWLSALLSDESISTHFCVRKGAPKTDCYSRRQVQRLSRLAAPCVQHAAKNTLPETGDATIFAMGFMIKTAESNGVLNYFARG